MSAAEKIDQLFFLSFLIARDLHSASTTRSLPSLARKDVHPSAITQEKKS